MNDQVQAQAQAQAQAQTQAEIQAYEEFVNKFETIIRQQGFIFEVEEYFPDNWNKNNLKHMCRTYTITKMDSTNIVCIKMTRTLMYIYITFEKGTINRLCADLVWNMNTVELTVDDITKQLTSNVDQLRAIEEENNILLQKAHSVKDYIEENFADRYRMSEIMRNGVPFFEIFSKNGAHDEILILNASVLCFQNLPEGQEEFELAGFVQPSTAKNDDHDYDHDKFFRFDLENRFRLYEKLSNFPNWKFI
jgi:hypothetical protein